MKSLHSKIPTIRIAWFRTALATMVGLSSYVMGHGQVRLDVASLTETEIGEIVSLTLSITNDAAENFHGTVRMTGSPGVRILGDSERVIELSPTGKRFLPVQVRIDQEATPGDAFVKIAVSDQKDQVVAEINSELSVRRVRNVFMQALSHRELMRHPGDSIHLPMYVKNVGNTEETIRILTSMPVSQGSPAREFTVAEVTLTPAMDTTIHMRFIVDDRMFSYAQLYVNVTGLYSDMEVFGNATVSLQNVASRRSYVHQLPEYDIWAREHNQISLSTRNPFQGQPTWHLQGRAVHQLGDGKALSYHLNVHQWGQNQTPSINNTWIRWDRNNRGFTVGNISESLEKYIFGRGIKVHFGDVTRNWTTEAGIVDKGYNLVGQNASEQWFDGYSAFVRSRHGMENNKGLRYSTLALYDRDPYENSESALYANTLDWIPGNGHRHTFAQFHFGAGLSRPLSSVSNGDRPLKPSLATGLIFNTQFGHYTLTSSNYYSSSYYPGTRRGMLQLNQRLTRNVGQTTLWAGHYHSDYEPSYLTTPNANAIYFFQSRVEVGLSQPWGPFMTVSISPRFEREKGRYFYRSVQPELLGQRSVKLQALWSWRSRDSKHFSSITQEAGWLTDSDFDANLRLHYRGTIAYSFQRLQLLGLYQYGFASISDHLSIGQWARTPYRASLDLSWSGYFFNKRLQADLGASVFQDDLTGGGLAANNRLQYNFNRTAFFAHNQWFRYRRNDFVSAPVIYTQMGIIQKLPDHAQRSAAKKGKMTLTLFYDHNHNGVFDEGDELAVGKSILIDNTLFLSNAKGIIQYTRVPYERYRLRIPVEDGWYAPERHIVLQKRHLQMEVPLQRSGTLRGKVIFDYDPRLSMETNTALEGFSITATSANGTSFSSRTDSYGRFLLFLPVGEYEIFLNEQEFPNHVFSKNSKQRIRIDAGKVVELPDFELNIEQKSIEVKRFGT